MCAKEFVAATRPSTISGFAPTGPDVTIFALYLGIALSITAVPVLVSIIQEQALDVSPIGVGGPFALAASTEIPPELRGDDTRLNQRALSEWARPQPSAFLDTADEPLGWAARPARAHRRSRP